MAQPTRSGASPIVPVLAGAIAAFVVVGGAWLAFRGDDETTAVTATVEDAPLRTTIGGAGETAETDTSETTVSASSTTQRSTEDVTDGTTIDDVAPSALPDSAPDSFVAVTDDRFELVRVDSRTGAVVEALGSWGPVGDEQPQALQFVELAPNGTIYVDDCCEPAYGTTFIVADRFDPGSTPQITGISPEISPDGSRLARTSQGSAISIADASGNEFGFFGDTDFSGDVLRPLTWIDSSTLVVTSTSGEGLHQLQILDVSDPSNPVVGARRVDPGTTCLTARGCTHLAADVRADGNILVVTAIDNGGEVADVIAEVIDPSSGQVIVDFNLPDDVYDADYDVSGRYLLTTGSNGQLDWYGGGQRGTIATGYVSAAW